MTTKKEAITEARKEAARNGSHLSELNYYRKLKKRNIHMVHRYLARGMTRSFKDKCLDVFYFIWRG